MLHFKICYFNMQNMYISIGESVKTEDCGLCNHSIGKCLGFPFYFLTERTKSSSFLYNKSVLFVLLFFLWSQVGIVLHQLIWSQSCRMK